MPFSNELLQDRSMRTERMLHASGGGEAAVVRSQLIQKAVVVDRRFPL